MSLLGLIRSSRDFRALFVSRVVSELGTWFAYIALTVAIYDLTHSARWVSVLLLLDLAPAIAVGFAIAPLLDRLVRKHALVASELAGGLVFVGLALAHGLGALLALAALAGVASSVFKPGLSAALPTLVGDDDLPRANALVRGAGSAAILAGPPLAGVLVAVAGTRPVFLVNAVSFAVSAALIARIPRDRLQQPRAAAGAGDKPRFRSGLALFRAPALRAVLASWSLVQFTWALVNVAEIFLARSVFHTGATGFGLLAACSGLGLLVGSLASSRLAERGSTPVVYRNALLVAGVGLAVAATAQWFVLALLAATVAAAGNMAAVTCADLILQREVPGERLGQAFGVFQACASAVAVVGMVTAGWIADALGGRGAWGAAAAVALAAAAISSLLARERAVPVLLVR